MLIFDMLTIFEARVLFFIKKYFHERTNKPPKLVLIFDMLTADALAHVLKAKGSLFHKSIFMMNALFPKLVNYQFTESHRPLFVLYAITQDGWQLSFALGPVHYTQVSLFIDTGI